MFTYLYALLAGMVFGSFFMLVAVRVPLGASIITAFTLLLLQICAKAKRTNPHHFILYTKRLLYEL